jgi:hypothetical protein
MLRKVLTAILVLAASLAALSADFTIRIASAPKEVPQGAPISVTVEVYNSSGHPITIAKGNGGFGYVLSVTRSDGKLRRGCKQPGTATFIPGFTRETLSADWRQLSAEDISCDDEPGEWIIQATISCRGPYPIYQRGQVAGEIEGWSGEVRSEEVRIKILKPEGVDLQAYSYFKRCPRCDDKKLLERFPTSTYAGYALLPAGQCIPDPRVFLVNFLEHDKTAERWPQTAGQMTSEKRKDIEDTEKRAAQLTAYLRARPDFARADALKVELAGRLAMLGRFDEAHALCDEITLKDAGSLESKKANMLMGFLVERGFQGEKKAVASPEPRQAAKPSNEKKP